MINQSKFEPFIEAAIRKTKAGVLTWKRVDTKKFHYQDWPEYDLSRSFICSYANGRMLLAYEGNLGIPHCYISPDATLPFQRVAGTDDASAPLLRLYNLVYSAFPSIESFIDAMINSDDDEEEPPF